MTINGEINFQKMELFFLCTSLSFLIGCKRFWDDCPPVNLPPNSKTNPYLYPNTNPNRGAIFLGAIVRIPLQTQIKPIVKMLNESNLFSWRFLCSSILLLNSNFIQNQYYLLVGVRDLLKNRSNIFAGTFIQK